MYSGRLLFIPAGAGKREVLSPDFYRYLSIISLWVVCPFEGTMNTKLQKMPVDIMLAVAGLQKQDIYILKNASSTLLTVGHTPRYH